MTGCSTAPDQHKFNEWTGAKPGTILFTGNITDQDFHAFYNQTTLPLDHYTVVLNTNGGEAMACVGIMSRIVELQKQGVKFTTVVYSKAYSAGAFIFMMGDSRIMHSGSSIMWHTMRAQIAHDGGELPGIPGTSQYSRKEIFDGLDEWVIEKTIEAMPNVDPMTLETMLRYSGMTFILAKQANELGMVDEYVEN